MLDINQLRSVIAFRRDLSVALLGGAGSGKSFVLSTILHEAREKHGHENVLACALTNQAASNIGGATIHSWFGVPPGFSFEKEELWNRLKNNNSKCQSLKRMKVIVVDECTVLMGNVLDSIYWVLRNVTEHGRYACLPMGGRQLIVAGDPFQLEPIGVDYTSEATSSVFSARCWLLTFGAFGSGIVSLLKGNHRQADDETFFKILDRLRIGKCTSDDLIRLNQTGSRTICSPDTHTVLCLKRKQVYVWNQKALDKIPGPELSIFAKDFVNDHVSEDIRRKLCDAAPTKVILKNGCDVILTRKSGGLLPGTRLTVTSVSKNFGRGGHFNSAFIVVHKVHSEDSLRLKPVRFEVHGHDGNVVAYRMQLPIVSAYALTVHRCQGLTLENVAMNFDEVGTWRPTGMVYVALSRCTSMNGLWVRGLKKEHIVVNQHALKVMKDIAILKRHFCDRVIGQIRELDYCVLQSVEESLLRKRRVTELYLETEDGIPLSRRSRNSF